MKLREVVRFLNRLGDVRRGWLAEWAVTIVILLFGTTTLLQAFVVPTPSMENSILVGDHVLMDKLAYSPPGAVTGRWLPYREVQRGDMIAFRYPLDISQTYVKRAIGVPGDHIRLADKQLILNGRAVKEPYVLHVPSFPDPYRDNFPSAAPMERLRPQAAAMLRDHVIDGELVVPPGFIFAMGDNRENSDDSRFWGLVPRENIIGMPLVIWWSFDAPTADLINGNIGIDHLVDVATHFFTRTRWSRTFRLLHPYPLGRG